MSDKQIPKKINWKDPVMAKLRKDVVKGFTHRAKVKACVRCKTKARHLIRSYVLRDETIKSYERCLHCAIITEFEHPEECPCKACRYVEYNFPKEASDKQKEKTVKIDPPPIKYEPF